MKEYEEDDNERARMKERAGQDGAAVVATYVDDVKLDATKRMRAVCWKVIRLIFKSGEPDGAEKFLGIVSSPPQNIGTYYVRTYNQTDYIRNMLAEAEEMKGRKFRACGTTGQSGSAPDPEELEKKSCAKADRSILGSSGYAVRGTRLDVTYTNNRLARFAERWGDWAEREEAHMLGYYRETEEYCLHMTNAGDVWEALKLGIWADSDHNEPRSTSGVLLALIGPAGSFYPLEWLSRILAIRGTSSGEDESMS